MTKEKFVVLHHDDEDGYGSLAAFIIGMEHLYDYTLVTEACQYNQPFPYHLIDENTNLHILDFSYSKEVLEDVKTKVKSIRVIDHHDTAAKELEGLDYCIFDMSKAGCVLAWHYYNGPESELPLLLYHIGDRDIWEFKHPHTKAIYAGFRALGDSKDIDHYLDIIDQGEDGIAMCKEVGDILLKQQDQIVASTMKKAKIVNICGFKVGFLNTNSLISEIGNALMLDESLDLDFSMSYFTTDKDVIFNLRSREGKTEVGKLCKSLEKDKVAKSGGGHPFAAGFVMGPDEGLWLVSEILKSDGANRINWHK